MAEPLDDFKKQQEELKESFQDLVTTFQDTMVGLSASTSQAFKQAIKQTSNDIDKQAQKLAKANISSAFKSATTAAGKLGKAIDDNTNKSIDSKAIIAKREDLEAKLNNLYRAREIAIRNGVDLTKEQLADLEEVEQSIVRASKEEEKRTKALEDRLGIFGVLFKEAKKIPFLGELIDADGAMQAITKSLKDGATSTEALGVGFTQAFKSIGSAFQKLLPLLIATQIYKTFEFLIKSMNLANERTVALAKTFGISRDMARGLREELEEVENNINKIYITTDDLIESQALLVNLLQRGGAISRDNLEAQSFLVERLGLAAETSANIVARSEAFGKSALENFDTILALNNELTNTGQSTGTINQIMEEVSGASGQVAASFGFSNVELAQAVIKLRQFGLNLTQARNISEGLLDFERSIGAELEAELFLGRELNLNRARSLAAVGDIDDATALVMDQMKGLTDEQRKSPIIMGALADVLGLSVDELQDAFLLETDRARQGLEQLKNYEKYKKEVEAVNKLQKLSRYERKKELDDLAEKYNITDTTRELLEENVTAQQTISEAFNKIQAQFADVLDDELISNLGDSLVSIVESISKIDERGLFGIKGIVKDVANFVQPGGAAPLLIKKFRPELFNQPIEESEDFIIRPGQPVQKFRKDDIVIGGTNLSGGSNKNVEGLLERIASAIESGGDVYIDGNKAGKAMVLASHKLS